MWKNMKIISAVFTLLITLNLNIIDTKCETILMTEVFALPVDPLMFNWTYEADDTYTYRPTITNKPDLPSWINFIYSKRHHQGYLYGVPQTHKNNMELEIIALNKVNYETRRYSFPININEKLNPAKYEVQLKIDNLNVEDMFDIQRMERLKDLFRKKLWKESEKDLYLTFLESAIHLGARLPLRPTEGEGVVIRFGSQLGFSVELTELQEEVKPLWKLHSCPRDFKRTTVDRFFREAGFALDWCAFRLLEDDGSALHQSTSVNDQLDEKYNSESDFNRWISVSKDDVPVRSYFHEFLFTIVIPMLVMIILVLILSLILCFHHEGIKDEMSDEYFDSIFHICIEYYSSKRMKETPVVQMAQYENIQRATQTLRVLSTNRDANNTSSDVILTTQSHTNSPNSSLARSYCRPSPPPYPAINKQDF